jgi:hypothetical protein
MFPERDAIAASADEPLPENEDEMRPRTRDEVQREIDEEIEEQREQPRVMSRNRRHVSTYGAGRSS